MTRCGWQGLGQLDDQATVLEAALLFTRSLMEPATQGLDLFGDASSQLSTQVMAVPETNSALLHAFETSVDTLDTAIVSDLPALGVFDDDLFGMDTMFDAVQASAPLPATPMISLNSAYLSPDNGLVIVDHQMRILDCNSHSLSMSKLNCWASSILAHLLMLQSVSHRYRR